MEKDVLDKVTDQGLVKDSDFTFWSTPAFKTSEAMSDTDLSDVLATIPFVDVAVINYIFESSELVKNPGKIFLCIITMISSTEGMIYFRMENLRKS